MTVQAPTHKTFYHVTVLSNLVRGYDKYGRRYTKQNIPESTYSDRFFLLKRDELAIGVKKADSLLQRLGLPGNRLIVLETTAAADELQPNLRNGLGQFVPRDWIRIERVHYLTPNLELIPQVIEDTCADSFTALGQQFAAYDDLAPRSLSVLPEPIGCQAACLFCFSKTSVSLDQKKALLEWSRLEDVMREAKHRGAQRAVITGGGEPSMLPTQRLEQLVTALAAQFSKVVLITNGYKWALLSEDDRLAQLQRLQEAGLSVMAISRHHHDATRNADIMRLDTQTDRLAATQRHHSDRMDTLKLRWICVLQKGGVQDRESLCGYLDWAVQSGVSEVCFKELYVSTSRESEYHDYKANRWSHDQQTPLSLVTDFAGEQNWQLVSELPWGAPVYEGIWHGAPIRIAAYTEPSLFWERSHGMCRSWNLMADGRCLASLEDRTSEVMAR